MIWLISFNHSLRYDENVTFTFTRSNAQKGQEPTFERNLNFEQFKSLLIESGDAAARKAEADLPVDTKMEQWEWLKWFLSI